MSARVPAHKPVRPAPAVPVRQTQPVAVPELERGLSVDERQGDRHSDGLLRQTAVDSRPTDRVSPIIHEALTSPGRPLEQATRAFMEPRFGHDFSRVRVHTDARAAESARVVSARAYTVGRDVVFGAGQYAPTTTAGRRLLAHEMAHVVQQRRQPVSLARQLIIGRHGSRHEGQADAAAEAVLVGGRPPTVSGAEIHVQRQGFGDLRLAEARLEQESVTDSAPVDGEFWIAPPNVRRRVVPVFDDEETQVVVGFRYESGGYWEVYDLDGKMVEVGERGLESPLIDPIDILAGGIAGLGRGLFGSAARGAAARGAAGATSRAGATALARTGVRAIGALGRAAITAVRAAYRAVRLRGPLNFTATTAARMADPARRVPYHILQLALHYGARAADPQQAAGAFRYVISMFRNGREYTLEVVIREADRMILHFLYR